MGRVLYFHHYFPALLFSSSLTAVVFDYLLKFILKFLNQKNRFIIFHTVYGVVVSIIIYSFYLFSPLSYGFQGNLFYNSFIIILLKKFFLSSQGSTYHDITNSDINNQTLNTLAYIKWLESWEF